MSKHTRDFLDDLKVQHNQEYITKEEKSKNDAKHLGINVEELEKKARPIRIAFLIIFGLIFISFFIGLKMNS